MSLDVPRALESLEDQRVLLPPDDVLHDLRLFAVVLSPADDGVEDLDQVEDVLADLVAAGAAEVEEVEELDLEGDALPADQDVVVVDVAVVFAAGVDGGDALCEVVKYVKGLKGA